MSNYVQTTFFTPKDSLPPSNPAKTIFGAAYDVEFGNIATAIASKFDTTSIATAPILFNLGTAALPGVAFVGQTGTGIYSDASGDLGLSTSGVDRILISGTTGGVTVVAPSSGVALTVNGVSGAASIVANFGSTGASTTAEIAVTAAGNTGGTTSLSMFQDNASAAHVWNRANTSLDLGTNNAARLSISNVGNVTIAAPSSGIGLIVEGGTGGAAASFDSANASFGGYIAFTNSGGNNAFLGSALGVLGTNLGDTALRAQGQLLFASGGGNTRITIASAGNVTIAAPTSGVALGITGVAGSNIVLSLSSTSTNAAGSLQFINSTTGDVAGIGMGGIINGQGVNDLGLYSQVGSVQIGRGNGTALGTTFGFAGNVTVAAPSSGNALTVNGINATQALTVNGGTGAGTIGVYCAAGGIQGDRCIYFTNSTGATTFVDVRGDGSMMVGNGVTPEGPGTLNVQNGYWFNGNPQQSYRALKPSTTSTSSNTVLTADGSLTFSLPIGTYTIRALIMPFSAGASGFKWGWITTGTMAGWFGDGGNSINGNSSTAAGTPQQTLATTKSVALVSGGQSDAIYITGQVSVTVAGVLTFAWAQAASVASNTSVGGGSWLQCDRIT
jgi:hypothetical protein